MPDLKAFLRCSVAGTRTDQFQECAMSLLREEHPQRLRCQPCSTGRQECYRR
jgi:hypothetical protein